MPTVSLNAFLKILSKSSPQKAAEYARYLKPGGYDFYRMLKDAIRARTLGGQSLAECSKPILKIHRLVEKKHNLEALKSFDKWLKPLDDVEFFEVPSTSIFSPSGHLKIKIEPTFGYVSKGQRRIVQTWATQTPALTQNVAACGLYLLKESLCIDTFGDCVPAVLDVRRRSLFISDALPRVIGPMVASEFAWADGFFIESAKAVA